jgi:hypothetical protein
LVRESHRTHRKKILVDFQNKLLELKETKKLNSPQLYLVNLYLDLICSAMDLDLAEESNFGSGTISAMFMGYSLGGDVANANSYLGWLPPKFVTKQINEMNTIQQLLQENGVQ